MILKLLSLLLRYPDDEVLAVREEIAHAAHHELPDSPAKESVLRFLLYWNGAPSRRLRTDYTGTFDFAAKNCLYLTYFRHGDQRLRGQVLVQVMQSYARAGYSMGTTELPDYLPVMLEFASVAPDEGLALISGYRSGLEVIRKSLLQRKSPYAHLIDALRSLLPEIEQGEVEEARELVVGGPPQETVGLEPYGPEAPQPPPQNVTFYGRKR